MQAEVRSALRALVRAQRITFNGDVRARQAARELNRQLLQPALSATSTPEEKAEAISGAKQVAQYLKSNVLQGIPKSDAEAAYELRFTPHTALGDNSTISKAKPAPSLEEIKSTMGKGVPGNTRRRRQRSTGTTADDGSSSPCQSGAGSAPAS